MGDKILRVGIIGTGNMGRRHGRAYRYHEPLTRLVACYDLYGDIAAKYAGEFSCESEDTIESLLAREDIDAVSICTTEEHHVEPVKKAAAAGKHILLEKPMAMNMEDARVMTEAARTAGVKLMVGHLYRFDRRCAAVKETLDQGKLGMLRSIACSFHGIPEQQDRIKHLELSIALFRGCHAIDLMRWFSGSEVKRVYAESLEGTLRSEGYHSEDAVFCLLRFESGVVASMEINSHAPKGHPTAGESCMTLIGTEGMVQIDFARPWFILADSEKVAYSSGDQKDLWFREEIEAFTRYVLEDTPSIATPEDAMAALKVSLAAAESAKTSRPVEIAE